MNRTTILGNVGKAPVVNVVNGKTVINFPVAVTNKFKNASGDTVEQTTWFDCALWRDSDAIAKYINKGDKIFCEGEISAKSYQKNDGSTGVSLVLRVQSVQLLGGGKGQSNEYAPAPANEEKTFTQDPDNIPF